MSEEVVGRAGFHAKHTKAVSERSAILHEAMRELDQQSIAYWAARNPNIVVADEPLNMAMVNDSSGGFARCTDRRQVLDYGESRVGLLSRKLREDAPDKNGKMTGGTVTTSLLVSHLPKSMCEEIEDFYPVLDSTTGEPVVDRNTGEPMRRSRWIAADRDEAVKYFEAVVDYLAENVIPGGRDAVLGYDIQFSESTPHIQIVADTFAADPRKPGRLRVDTSRAWFSHRDVRDEQGKVKSGPAKMREYHEGLKQHLIERGYDISPDFDEERHLAGMGKEEFGRSMDAERVAVAEREYVETKLAAKISVAEKDSKAAWEYKQAAKAELAAAEKERAAATAELEEAVEIKRRAKADGHREGYENGRLEAQVQLAEMTRLAEGERAEAARQADAARVARRALEETEERLEAELARVVEEPPDFKRFLDTPRKDGKTMRDVYNRAMAPVWASRASRAALLDEVRQEAKHSGAYDLEL
ncbi:hypothetical protein SAMN02745244_01632 [Tessaracoccus bendigoensis DSM 12906]|uniref:Plasmid recombination enzyme n=1 Tax=Tessaracoccus bendigoensis DSM 12906 TaxID=1123357 RepID=A0A1M6G883_9ACTN|nr:hypothetical protein [Tessaracoccus bendigoensis]SHJ06146.1 hypothetical protein SAMN02745244_01632 [Tessaracoccus bendigoensis DSM 12906]